MERGALPAGRYLSGTAFLSPDAGGQTRAMVLRNSTLAREAGIRPEIVVFTPAPDYPERAALLRERGLLDPAVQVRSIYDHYAEHGWGDPRPRGRALEDLGRFKRGEDVRPDGSPWRVRYRRPGGRGPVHDYLRADGSPYLRVEPFDVGDPATWAPLTRVAPNGEVLDEIASPAAWFRGWVRELTAGHERSFLFLDARALVPSLAPLTAPGIHLVYLLHNIHLRPPYRWDSPVTPVYGRMLERIGDLDAFVTLTERQREDIAERLGDRSNLFVVPNPVTFPEQPAPAQRDPRLVTVVARLERQKRLVQAIRVFEQVLRQVPDARLEIYGSGAQERRLRRVIRRRGLEGSVHLKGYDPHAADALDRSSAFLMTSGWEGYPLATLESMSRGCPVVSYDIKYGPREQIDDGVDGFLVGDGDRAGAASRVVRLLRSPELVEQMGRAAVEKARQHGTERFVRDWGDVLHAVVEQKPRRTSLDGLRLVVAGRSAVVGSPRRVPALASARVSLDRIDSATGEVTPLPVSVSRGGRFLRVTAREPLGRAVEDGWLRLRLVAENAAWERRLG